MYFQISMPLRSIKSREYGRGGTPSLFPIETAVNGATDVRRYVRHLLQVSLLYGSSSIGVQIFIKLGR